MNIWNNISTRLKKIEQPDEDLIRIPRVNNHIHTPYSFSAFDSIDNIIEAAKKENISVLGINDFNTPGGFPEWAEKCFNNNIFPIFNIEMIGLNKADMKNGLRINDPHNPGRVYISGKALAYPLKLSDWHAGRLKLIRDLSNDHVYRMTLKINDILGTVNDRLIVDFDEMLRDHTMGMVRERHLAGMVRINIEKIYREEKEIKDVYTRLLGEDIEPAGINDKAYLENIIRSRLLKAGGEAFVKEDPEVFIESQDIRDIILDAGGIPAYPFLADFKDGMYTEFEYDREQAALRLAEGGFHSVEFIPARNNYQLFKEYVMFLYDKGFIITFGTEHNAPGEKPLGVFADGNKKLDNDLLRINYEGACILAAHQYLYATTGAGYLDKKGKPQKNKKEKFVKLGDRLIKLVNKGLY
ncbi:MAG TPA: hypothetical protein DEQ09_02835 [Bacteroidales bacterium]|nr:hypothetical protein [Bacteroidales bacterium]